MADTQKMRMLYDMEFRNGFLKKGQIVDVVGISPQHPRAKCRVLRVKDSEGTEFFITNGEAEAT